MNSKWAVIDRQVIRAAKDLERAAQSGAPANDQLRRYELARERQAELREAVAS